MWSQLIPVGRFCNALAFIAAVAWTTVVGAAPLEEWHWRNPLPQGNPLNNVVFANGRYLAVGELGTILSSTDGTNWVRRTSGTAATLRDCAYGAGKYVVVGDFGTVLTSVDATNWTPQYAGSFFSLNGIVYADGKFVAVGEQTIVLTSPDGITWTQRSSGNWKLLDVIYAEGTFVAAGGRRGDSFTTETGVLLTSPDGVSWTYRLITGGPTFGSLVHGAGSFVVVGQSQSGFGSTLWSSDNALDWQQHNPPTSSPYGTLGYGNGQWVLFSGAFYSYFSIGSILASDNLSSWQVVVSNTPGVSGIVFDGGKFLASRADGTFLISSNGTAWQDPWPNFTNPIPEAFRDLEYLNGAFWGVGLSQISISTGGTFWTNNFAVPIVTGPLLSLTYGKGLYVAGSEYRTIWISADGLNWTNPAPNLSVQPYVSDVAVAYGNGVFVGAAGYAADILTSADGTNWIVQQLHTNQYESVYFTDVTFANGRFVAVAVNGIGTSVDGTNWFFDFQHRNLGSVSGGNGIFVAVGFNTIATSIDGTNWTTQSSSSFGPLAGVAFGQGFFVAAGVQDSSVQGLAQESPIWISTDGVHWSRRFSETSRGLSKVAFGNGTFVISGEASAILQSDPVVTLQLTLQPAQLLLSGPTNRSYRIDYANALSRSNDWKMLTTLVATNSPTAITDITSSNSSSRFYRAVLLP